MSAKGQLPELIRRLVLETTPTATRVDFPAAEGVAVGDWDGVVTAKADTAFVPSGLSLWELSAGRRTTAKADTDYGKRASTPDGTPPAEATYCAVSVRRWRDRRQWATSKSRQGRWKAVEAFGVDDIETWLNAAPVTHAWFSEMLGLRPFGMRTPTTWWSGWAEATTPHLTPDVVLAGRDSAVRELIAVLRGAPSITSVRADSPNEVFAIVSAALLGEAEAHGDLLARTLYVDDVMALRRLSDYRQPLVIVALSPEVVAESRGASGHHVVVPVGGDAGADIEVPPLDEVAASQALQTLGMDSERADESGELGRRSFLALRRHLAIKPELDTPPWAQSPVPRTVRAALLATKWDDDSEADQTQLAALAGTSYDALREELARLSSGEDPYLIRAGDTWSVVSPYDAWHQLRSSITPDDLTRFGTLTLDVLLEEDPALRLEQSERWRAGVDGHVRSHSATLRAGVATGLALLGTVGEKIPAGRGSTGSVRASRLVEQLLESANTDKTGAVWTILVPYMSLLAEAAPDAFLAGVRAGLGRPERPAMAVFQDGGDFNPLFSSSGHSWLLWALEVVAWSPEHFGQAIDVLAQLAEFDPGGRMSNRPSESLARIFCPWYPETSVSARRRLDVIDAMRGRHFSIAWNLMIALLPEDHAVHFPTSRPRYRNWKPPHRPRTRTEVFEWATEVTQRLIEDAADSPARWQELISRSASLPPNARAAVRDGLREVVVADKLTAEGRDALWEEIRALVAQHRTYANAYWALPEDELVQFDGLGEHLRPPDVVSRHAWLFSDRPPDLGDGSRHRGGEYDHASYIAALDARRRAAVQEILASDGWEGILRAARTAAATGSYSAEPSLGEAIAEIDLGTNEPAVLDLLVKGEHESLARAYLSVRFRVGGWDWLEQRLPDLPAEQQAALLLLTYEHPRSWQRADELGPAVASVFWQRFSAFSLGSNSPHVQEVAARLLGAKRASTTLHLLNLYAFRNATDAGPELAALTARALEMLLEQEPSDENTERLNSVEPGRVWRGLDF